MSELSGIVDNRTSSIRGPTESVTLSDGDRGAIAIAANDVSAAELTAAGIEVAGAGLSTDRLDGTKSRSTENPAKFLADPTSSAEQIGQRLRSMSTAEFTRTIRSADGAGMDHGAAVTSEGWKAMRAEVGNRFGDALQGREANAELARLSQEVVRTPQLRGEPNERSWRSVAPTLVDPRTSEAQETLRTLDKTTRMQGNYVNGGLLPADMNNAELLEKVGQIPGMKTAGDVISLTGVPGVLASAAGDAKAKDRLSELQRRMDAGHIEPFTPDTGEGSPLARGAGLAVAGAQVIAAATPKRWVENGAKALRGGVRMTASEARVSGALREAAKGKGNFNLGSLTRSEAMTAGEAWVGNGAIRTVGQQGETILTSADGMRRYRDFATKTGRGPESTRANLESLWFDRFGRTQHRRDKWSVNGHIELAPDPKPWYQRVLPK